MLYSYYVFVSIDVGAQVAIILLACGPCVVIVDYWDRFCTLGRAPRTKVTLPDFREWCRVTRHPLVGNYHYWAFLTLSRDHYFRYKECARGRLSLEAAFFKKAGLWLWYLRCIHVLKF